MNERILIIESEIPKLKKLREVLSKEGFSIMTVTDQTTAIQLCKTIDITYIIANPANLGITQTMETQNQSK